MEASYFVLLLLLVIVGGVLTCSCCLCGLAFCFFGKVAHFVRFMFLGPRRRGDKLRAGGSADGRRGVYYQVRHGEAAPLSAAATEASLLSDASDAAMYQHAEVYVVPPLVAVRESDDSTCVQLSSSATPDDGVDNNGRCSGDFGNFKDIYFIILFVANVIAIMGLFLADASTTLSTSGAAPPSALPALVLVGLGAALAGSALLSLLIKNAKHIIIYSLWSGVFINTIIGISLLLSVVAFLPGLLFLLFAAINYFYLKSIRDRIPFAASMLQIASKALSDNFTGVLACAFLFSILQVGWLIITSVCLFNEASKDDDSRSNMLVVFLIFSLYWGNQFFIYALDVTISGTTACHYFLPHRQAIVSGSLFRALTTSAGSIAFGSLIIALLSTLHTLLQAAVNRGRRRREIRSAALICVLEILDYLLRLVESATQYFNRYTFAYVGCFGMGYIESSNKVASLFREKGWDAIINDNLISQVLSFGVLLFATICGATSYLLGAAFGQSLTSYGVADPAATLAVLGAALAAAVGAVCVRALVSAVATLFVCFAESPEALLSNHPAEYALLQGSWDLLGGPRREGLPSVKALPVASVV